MAWQLAACGACAAGETARVPCRAQSIATSSIVLAGLGNPKAQAVCRQHSEGQAGSLLQLISIGCTTLLTDPCRKHIGRSAGWHGQTAWAGLVLRW